MNPRIKTLQPIFPIILLVITTVLYYQGKSAELPNYPIKMTMFTTLRSKEAKFRTYSNTIRNWALFIPQIQPILFAYETDDKLVDLATSLGWIVLEAPRVSPSKVPYLKEMYFAAEQHSKSVFYGYFNGDLLFDDGLIDSILTLEKYVEQLKMPLVVGQRTNVPLRDRELWRKHEVTESAKEGKLFLLNAEDYFILHGNKFIWDGWEDVIIGRPGYDNYFVALALNHNLSAIDATQTILTVHQTGEDGTHAGFKDKDSKYNLEVLSHFNRTRGYVNNCPLMTKKNRHGKVELWQRWPKKRVKRKHLT